MPNQIAEAQPGDAIVLGQNTILIFGCVGTTSSNSSSWVVYGESQVQRYSRLIAYICTTPTQLRTMHICCYGCGHRLDADMGLG